MLHGTTQCGIWKTITVAKLREVLNQLDNDNLLECNEVNNILVFRGEQSDIEKTQIIGYIDIANEEFEPWED